MSHALTPCDVGSLKDRAGRLPPRREFWPRASLPGRVQRQRCGLVGEARPHPPPQEPGWESLAPAAPRRKRGGAKASLRGSALSLSVTGESGGFLNSCVPAIFRRRPAWGACLCSRREAAARSSGEKRGKSEGGAAGPSSRPERSRKPALRPTVPFGPQAYLYLTLLGPSHAHDLEKSWIRAPWSPATPREVAEPPTDPANMSGLRRRVPHPRNPPHTLFLGSRGRGGLKLPIYPSPALPASPS